MTENRARAVEEPTGYDYPETDRIPVPGDLSDGRADTPRSNADGPRPSTPFEMPAQPPATPVEQVESVESAQTQDLTPEPTPGTAKVEEEQDFFDTSEIDGFRDRWRELQAGFVDDPAQAVRGANDLVDEIMRELAERKDHLEGKWRDASDGKVGTEELRVVIREYRAFFDRLLNA